MKKNIGIGDRIVRILFAVVVGILYFAGVLSGPVALILGGIAAVLFLTSLVGVCPLYLPFHFTTRGKSHGV